MAPSRSSATRLHEPSASSPPACGKTSPALRRVGDQSRQLVEEAVRELEKVELNGLRPTLIGLARAAVDRDS